MKARAYVGDVVIDTGITIHDPRREITLSRGEAADFFVDLAVAILHSGDISDPDVQEAVTAAFNLKKYLQK